MKNIVAPKDPEKMRPFFYIMRDKEIYGSKMEDGRGIQYLYQSDGRLESSAKVTGSIEDEQIIELLKTVDGFKKLVHSVGVSIELEDKDAKAEFIFQMYGKKDLYGGGANIQGMVDGSGSETRLYLSDVDWQDDDDIPGQIKIIMDEPDKLGNLTVRLYLNDGFTAPEQEEEHEIDTASDAYKKMISNSLIQTGNTYRLSQVISKAKSGERVTLAYIGGSITQGAGATPINTECYAYKTFKGFCDIAGCPTDGNVKYIKAGVGGTPSEYGMLRYRRDILDECEGEGPDVVVVEFAVNDEGDETKGECFDSIVRKIYDGPGKPAVILEFAVFANDWNLQDRLGIVGTTYDLPMASALDSVVEQFKLSPGEGRVLSKSQYFYDMFHPTNYGHTIMADGILNLIRIADEADVDEEILSLEDILAPIGDEFAKVELLDKLVNNCGAKIDEGDFTDTDTVVQCVERNLDLGCTPQMPNNWMYKGTEGRTNKAFVMDVECTALLLIFKDSADNKDGKADVFVDGEHVMTADPRLVGWTHCDPVIILRGAKRKIHHVEITMAEGCEDKDFTILGFGVVS